MSCPAKPSAPNTLFDVGDDKIVSHNFEVKAGEVYVITAQGLMDDDVIAVETVTGCGLGDMFECYTSPSCGCPVTLNCGTPRIVIPFTGRYRLNITNGAPGEYRVTAYPTASVGFTEGNMACGCSSASQGAGSVDAILGSPSALAGLCTGLAPCIAAAVQAAVTPAPGGGGAPSPIVISVVDTITSNPTLVTELFDALIPQIEAAIPPAAHNAPAAFVLLEDAFGTDLGYIFPV